MILTFVIVYLAVAVLYFFKIISSYSVEAALYAGLLNLINLFIAYFLFKNSVGKSGNTFVAFNLGGIGIRMIFLLISIALIIKFLKIDKYAFILVFFLIYFILLSLEVAYIIVNKKVIKNQTDKNGL